MKLIARWWGEELLLIINKFRRQLSPKEYHVLYTLQCSWTGDTSEEELLSTLDMSKKDIDLAVEELVRRGYATRLNMAPSWIRITTKGENKAIRHFP